MGTCDHIKLDWQFKEISSGLLFSFQLPTFILSFNNRHHMRCTVKIEDDLSSDSQDVFTIMEFYLPGPYPFLTLPLVITS